MKGFRQVTEAELEEAARSRKSVTKEVVRIVDPPIQVWTDTATGVEFGLVKAPYNPKTDQWTYWIREAP